MQELITIFELPFMQRALIGGVLIAVLTSWMGILVVLRQSSFYGDAIAHSSLTGVALGLMFGFDPILVAAIYAIFISFLLPYLRKHSNLPIDSLLGFILPFSMAIGVILLGLLPGYQPELISFLFGSILAVSWEGILVIIGLIAAAVLLNLFYRKKLIFVSFDSEYARISGIKVEVIDVLYQILLAVTIVAGIRFVGIVLVNALLVIPASTVRIYARSLNQMFLFTPILSLFTVIAGLLASFYFDIPTGPSIAAFSGVVFLLALIGKKR